MSGKTQFGAMVNGKEIADLLRNVADAIESHHIHASSRQNLMDCVREEIRWPSFELPSDYTKLTVRFEGWQPELARLSAEAGTWNVSVEEQNKAYYAKRRDDAERDIQV